MQWLTGNPGTWLLLALALYGVVSAISEGVRLFQRLTGPADRAPLQLLVLVQNQESQIEGFVRSLSSLMRESPSQLGRSDLILVDLASTDDTPRILDRLAGQEQHIRLIKLPDKEASEAYEIAHFLSETAVVMLIDLRGRVDGQTVLRTLSHVW